MRIASLFRQNVNKLLNKGCNLTNYRSLLVAVSTYEFIQRQYYNSALMLGAVVMSWSE